MRDRTILLVLAVITMVGAMAFHAQAQEAGKQKSADKNVEERIRKLDAQKKERKAALDKLIDDAGDRLKPLLAYSIEDLQLALSVKVRDTYTGARIVSDEEEPRFLGTVSDNLDASSIFNEIGRHGSAFAPDSIWNQFGRYGGQFSPQSPFNAFSSQFPMLMKGDKVIGRLTVSRVAPGGVDPNWLRSFYVN